MDRIEAIDYENFDRWQSINDLNCNDIDMSYVDKIRLYQYYDTTLHILCLLETSFKGFNSVDDYYNLNERFITMNTFLIIKGLFLRKELLDTKRFMIKCIITFLKNEKYIRSIKLENILSENSIDYTEEFIVWYKKFSQENQFINRPIY